METSETTIIEKVAEKFKSDLPEGFSLKPEDKWIISKGYVSFDLALYYNKRLYAIVDLKINLSSDVIIERFKNSVRSVECRFGILTDGKKCYLYDVNTEEVSELDFEAIIKRLISSVTEYDGSQVLGNDMKNLLKDNNLDLFFDKIVRDVSFKDKWVFVSLDVEQEFFGEIFNKGKSITEFCRYTSLDSLMKMLSDGTYQMCGIVGMNDKSEIDYFDKQILGEDHSIPERVGNDVYISSGSSLKDDLTMWRLYGDNGMGVCLVFEMNPLTNFYIAKVSYAEDKCSHKLAEFIKEIKSKGMKFNNLNIWKHFFKPHDYSVEEEIRLMFYENSEFSSTDDKKVWIKANGSSIVIPAMRFKFPSDNFPLTLKTIILGPKINEPDINKVQIEAMIKDIHNMHSVKVEYSSIKHYR